MRVSTDIYLFLLQVSFTSLLNMFAHPNLSKRCIEKSVEDIYCYEAAEKHKHLLTKNIKKHKKYVSTK